MRKYCLLISLGWMLCSLRGEEAAGTAGYRYFLGGVDLAGMVPAEMPVPGTSLHCESVEQPLRDAEGRAAGFIPARYREAVASMLAAGLVLHFDVEHVYAAPLPGKFVRVEIWVDTDRAELLKPLIVAVPVLPPSGELTQIDPDAGR